MFHINVRKISLFRHFSRIFLIFNIFGSTINESPDCVRIKRSSLYLDPLVLSLCHRGCGEGCGTWIINNIGLSDLKSSLLVLSISLTTGSFIFHDTLSIPLKSFLSQCRKRSLKYASRISYIKMFQLDTFSFTLNKKYKDFNNLHDKHIDERKYINKATK